MRRRLWLGVALVALWLGFAPVARAGIYISSENRNFDTDLRQIKKLNGTLRSLMLPARANDEDRRLYEAVFAALEAKEKANTLTAVDRADLGGLLLRFGR